MDTRPFLGILMLDTRFPRVRGDVGHPDSWRMPVRCRSVAGASPQRVVRECDPTLLQPFIEAALALQAEGARALTTSCGFLLCFQDALQAALEIPIWTSSLLALPHLPQPGVITVDATSLRIDTPVEGLEPGCALQRTLLDDLPQLDIAAARADTVAAAQRLVVRHPEIESIVLECTNLPPYAEAIEQATGRPVHHLMTLVHERWEEAAHPRSGFAAPPQGGNASRPAKPDPRRSLGLAPTSAQSNRANRAPE